MDERRLARSDPVVNPGAHAVLGCHLGGYERGLVPGVSGHHDPMVTLLAAA